MEVEYTWIFWQGKNCRQIRLLTWISFISQFIHLVEGKGMGVKVVDRYFSQLQFSL